MGVFQQRLEDILLRVVRLTDHQKGGSTVSLENETEAQWELVPERWCSQESLGIKG